MPLLVFTSFHQLRLVCHFLLQMGKKKFIDKKKAATYHLFARDSSEIGQSAGTDSDHFFMRVDNNPVNIDGFYETPEDDSNFDGVADDPDSIFAGADEDESNKAEIRPKWQLEPSEPLPDHLRREMLELGFPDDGYNYLIHMREIKNTGGGSAYYENPKLNLDLVQLDVKAYDASKIRVEGVNFEANEEKLMYSVAEKTLNVRVQKAVDPDVTALLDDDNSQLGSDVEDLEEDFVVQANLPEEADSSVERDRNLADESENHIADELSSHHMIRDLDQADDHPDEGKVKFDEKPRARRLLDDQYDLLELQEYGTDIDNDYGKFEDEEPLAKKLSNPHKDYKIDELELYDTYKTPADLLHSEDKQLEELSGPAADVLWRCAEYAEKYENDNEDESEVVVEEESSDEPEGVDCETIISTYSNLDNHPGRIGASEVARKKKLAETVSGVLKSNNGNDVITLRGKETLPVDYLRHGKSVCKEKVKVAAKAELPRRRPQGQESKEEKKERKDAVKEEKREARRLKKETKELYRGEAKLAQKIASVSGPSSIRLM